MKDINARIESLGSFPEEFTRVGNTVFFRAMDPAHGHELWKTDGTMAGTVLVKDLLSGTTGGFPRNLTAVGDMLFFTASNSTGGTILWKSDGSEEGTVPAVELLSGGFTATLKDFVGVEDKLFFIRDQGRFPTPAIYASNGSAEGTVLLNPADWEDGGILNRRFQHPEAGLPFLRDSLIFPANNRELWVSNGSLEGTEKVSELPVGSAYLEMLCGVGGDIFMTAEDAEGNAELWKREWRSNPVEKVYGQENGVPLHGIYEAVNAEGRLFFTSSDDEGGHELWTSNGSTVGTRRVKDISPGAPGSNPRDLTAVGETVYFLIDAANQTQVWASDGTAKGTRKIFPAGKKKAGKPRLLTSYGDGICFVTDDASGTSLWKSNGGAKGTAMLKRIAGKQDGYGASQLMPLGKSLLFAGNDGKQGTELWVSDGTSRGTKLLKNLSGGTEDGYEPWDEVPMAALGDRVFFRANDGLRGEELWMTDGTAAGTRLVRDMVPGLVGSEPRQMTEAGGSVYFVIQDPEARDVLWKTDGTPVGTLKVLDPRTDHLAAYIGGLTSFNGRLFFTAEEADKENLWSSDGTAAGTYTIHPSGVPLEFLSFLTVFGGDLYFSAFWGETGEELWRSDGTAAGSAMVKELRPGELGSSPSFLTPVGSSVFFRAFTDFSGIQLWKSDGSADGTVQVNAPGVWETGSEIYPLIPVEEMLYFFADDGVHGNELWRSDGSPAGTAMVKDIDPEGGQIDHYGSEANFAAMGEILYFMADDGVHGEELWRSDGTESGSFMVADLLPGAGHSRPADLIMVGERIYFSADDGNHGREWWTSDGTVEGTVMVVDLSPGSGGSDPRAPFLNGKKLYFRANTPETGSELWVMDGVE